MAPFQPTTAEMRALDQIATPDGQFAVLAIDQRVSLRRLRARVDRPADDATLRLIKSDVLSILGPYASASLLDPELALPDLVQAGVQSGQRGLLVSIENSRDRSDPEGRLTSLIPGFGAEGVRRYGGTAAKLLITIRPDDEAEADQVLSLVRVAQDDCLRHDLLLVVEVLVDARPDESPDEFAEHFPTLLVQAATRIVSLGVRMLKLPWPGSDDACRRITAIGVPWAVLSAGLDYETFHERLSTCLKAGCSGFVAGRTLWQDAVVLDGPGRRHHLTDHGVRRLRAMTDALSQGKNWRSFLPGYVPQRDANASANTGA
jgi:tagatose 1,6-diphosphate aldolase